MKGKRLTGGEKHGERMKDIGRITERGKKREQCGERKRGRKERERERGREARIVKCVRRGGVREPWPVRD